MTKQEAQEKYTFFWRNKSPFSQWNANGFTVDGVHYKTAEHWMMAEKAKLFGDKESEEKIIASKNPFEAKKLGRGVKNFDHALWESKCLDIVTQGNIHKFGQNPELKKQLLATVGTEMVEASPKDAIWGIGLDEDDHRAWDKSTWQGKNYLGICLDRAREVLLND